MNLQESIRKVLREEDRYDDKVGKTFWFEYHCYESPESCDAEIWYRSHQKVKVIGVSEWSYDDKEWRQEDGNPRVYLVEWEDGFQYDVFEDELMESPNEFYRPSPPKRKIQESIRRIVKEEDFIPLEDLYTVIKDYEDGFDVSIMNTDKKIGEISFAKENKPNQYTIVDATIDDEYKGNRIYPKTIINLFKERPNLIINSVFRSPEAEKAWRYILSDLPSNIEHKVKYYEDEETTLYQLKLKNLQESIKRILKEEMEPGIFIEFIERMLEHFKKKDCICDIRVTFDVEDPDYNIYLVFSQEELHDKFLNLYRIRSYIQEMRDEVKMQLEVFLPIRNIFVGYYTKPNCEWSPLNESKGKKEDYFLKLINDLIQRVKSTNNNICDMWVEYNSEDGDYEIRSSSPIRYYQLHDSGLSDVLSLIDNTISSWGLNVYVFAPYYVENCGDKIEYINESKLSGNTNLQKKVIDLIKSNGVNVVVTALGDFLNLFKILDINSPMEFLHLFNDLDVVQSEQEPDWTLLRYKPKHNLMIHNKKNDNVYINYDEIWKFLEDFFNLKYSEIKELIEEWLFEVYNLRGITPIYLRWTSRQRVV